MEEKKQLYPLQFIPIASKSPWGGDALIRQLGKDFVEADEEGNEHHLTTEDRIGESWEIADMGFRDSLVSEGWLAGNSISDLMETYLDRIVGERSSTSTDASSRCLSNIWISMTSSPSRCILTTRQPSPATTHSARPRCGI